MKRFIRLPGARICGAFLAGMLLVAAAVLVFNLYGPPHQSWAEDNGLGPACRCPVWGRTQFRILLPISPAVFALIQLAKTRVITLFDDPFFRQFFGDQLRIPSTGSAAGMGSVHRVLRRVHPDQRACGQRADTIEVTPASRNEPYTARLVGSDHDLIWRYEN